MCLLTCRKAALASKASVESVVMETSAVGVPEVGMAAGERPGVEVREKSSGGVPLGKHSEVQQNRKTSSQHFISHCHPTKNDTFISLEPTL